LKKKLASQEISVDGINLFTLGPHGCRSRIVYGKVFGPEVAIGVISYPSKEYDAEKWWTVSAGVKSIINETLAWGYEWLLDSGRGGPGV